MKKLISFIIAAFFIVPTFAFAQTATNLQTVYTSALQQLISLLVQEVAQLEQQLAALNAKQDSIQSEIASSTITQATSTPTSTYTPSPTLTQLQQTAPQVVQASPAPTWTPTGQYMVSNQFALDSDARSEWLNSPDSVYNLQTQKVMATSSFQFTIAGRLTQYESSPAPDPKCNCTESWFPMSGIPLTITYGGQSHAATTDANGVAIATFNATGVPGSHPFSYSSPGLNITDSGTVTENPITPPSTTSTTTQQQPTSTSSQSATSSVDAYNAAQCTAQKEALVTQANQIYLTWFAQWQAARGSLDSCYSTNPLPVCDKQMSDLNVQWQNKLTEQFDALDNELTNCAPDDRYFSDVSSVVGAPY